MDGKMLEDKIHVRGETGFTCRYVRSETEYFSPHYHNYYELFLIVRNKAQHLVNGKKQLLSEGDLLFIRDFDCHVYMPESGENFDFINLAFKKDILSKLLDYLEDGFDFEKLLKSPMPQTVSLSQRGKARLSEKLSDLNYGTVREQKLKLKKLLVEVFTEYFAEEKGRENVVPPWLESLCEKMKRTENFTRGTERMFELSGKSREHIARSMKKYYGVTPSEYVCELKLSYAANMLKFSNLSVTDICFECGFFNVSWFYEKFRERFGLPPSSYRKRCQYEDE